VTDMVTHSSVSAFAFALYTMSMGPHWALLQTQFKIPNVLPGLVMVVFPMIVGLLGDTYVQKPDPEDQSQAQSQAEVAPLVNREVINDSHPLKVSEFTHHVAVNASGTIVYCTIDLWRALYETQATIFRAGEGRGESGACRQRCHARRCHGHRTTCISLESGAQSHMHVPSMIGDFKHRRSSVLYLDMTLTSETLFLRFKAQ
jgi:hypothetical protein